MKVQLCIVYLVSALTKLYSPIWRNGSATYYIFHNARYFKLPSIIPYLENSDILIKLTSYVPMIFLILFPIFVWNKKGWVFILASFIFHGFICLAMGLREFMIFPILDMILFCDMKLVEQFSFEIKKRITLYFPIRFKISS